MTSQDDKTVTSPPATAPADKAAPRPASATVPDTVAATESNAAAPSTATSTAPTANAERARAATDPDAKGAGAAGKVDFDAATRMAAGQITKKVVDNANDWRRAYMEAFEARRRSIFQAVKLQRVQALAEFAKLIPPVPKAKTGTPEPSKAETRFTKLDPSLAAATGEINKTIEAMIAERIVERLRGMITEEVRRQLTEKENEGGPVIGEREVNTPTHDAA